MSAWRKSSSEVERTGGNTNVVCQRLLSVIKDIIREMIKKMSEVQPMGNFHAFLRLSSSFDALSALELTIIRGIVKKLYWD